MQNLNKLGVLTSFCLVLVLTGCSSLQKSDADSPGVALAQRYGLSQWEHVERIDFTFAVDSASGRNTRRDWSWDVKNNTFTAKPGQDEARTIALDNVPEDAKGEHRGFINDSYWLLFPYYIVWSDNTVIDHGMTTMPSSEDPAHKLTVLFPSEGGYTPGDAYDLYINPEDGLIKYWVFRRGNGDGGNPVSFEGHVGMNGLQIDTDHRGTPESGFRLFFPNVKVWFRDGAVATFSDGEVTHE